MTPTWRVVVTGSRTWLDPVPVVAALNEVWAVAVAARSGRLAVMEGKCPIGADRWAGLWCRNARFPGVEHLERPARWTGHGERCGRTKDPTRGCDDPAGPKCRAAGFRRNTEMVEEVADPGFPAVLRLCLAFVRNGSGGASHCAAEADRVGLVVVRFDWSTWQLGLPELRKSLQDA